MGSHWAITPGPPKHVCHAFLWLQKSLKMCVRSARSNILIQTVCIRASPSPSLDSASAERSLCLHRGEWLRACSLLSTGSREPRDPPEPYSTHDAPSSPGRTTPSTATNKGHARWVIIKREQLSSNHSYLQPSFVAHSVKSFQVTSHHGK